MAERNLIINNYRNVGISKEQKILLNTSIKPGELGGLVVVVGPNNSGKSNCLDALLSLGKEGELSRNDIPDFYNFTNNPEITLNIKDELINVGMFKKLDDDKEIIESYYETKKEGRKTKIVHEIRVSEEAQQFAEKMLSLTPLTYETEIIPSDEDKDFGLAVLSFINAKWGILRNIDPNAYEFFKNNKESLWMENKADIFSKVFTFIRNQYHIDRWYQYLPQPYNSISIENFNQKQLNLVTPKETVELPLSASTKILIRALTRKSSKKIKIEPEKAKLIAINMINNAVKEDNREATRKKRRLYSSPELIELQKTINLKDLSPNDHIKGLLDEAHGILSDILGPRYYNNNLNVSKTELDNCLDYFGSDDNHETDPNNKIQLNCKKHSKEINEVYHVLENHFGEDFYQTKLKLNYTKEQIQKFMYQITTKTEEKELPEIGKWQEDNQLMLQPNIIRFIETHIDQHSLSTNPSKLKQSEFFNILFKAINYNPEELISLYSNLKNGTKVTGSLRVTEKEINKKLEVISDQFNRLFFQSKEKYNFEIILETEKIEFSIYVGELPLNLDKQSTGFKWFFNFYFTVIAQKGLTRGDIVIMDEPATNLHVSGIQELRHFMKDFAIKSELTFVISTHSPFFIDIDHLEELRVVNRDNGEAIINNKFQVIEDDDTDALRPIKEALTVGRHVLIDPSKKTIFVEGLTDYCYLTAFKKIFPDANGLHFLPIQGLKKEDILGKILKIDKYPTILVDADHYGNGLKKIAEDPAYKGKVEVIRLNEIDSTFIDIESLFDVSERPEKKSFSHAVTIKNKILQESINEVTYENFKKVLKNISL